MLYTGVLHVLYRVVEPEARQQSIIHYFKVQIENFNFRVLGDGLGEKKKEKRKRGIAASIRASKELGRLELISCRSRSR
jgi:hypothetical protein